MKPFWKTNSNFQIRWNEPLGEKECPYAYRFVIILFGYSIRLHYWLRSDDKRNMHDHPWNFRTFVLKGYYWDVSEPKFDTGGEVYEYVNTTAYRKATHKHYVKIDKPGTITLLFCGRPYNKWGFWLKGKKTMWRPLRYFSKFGHPPCSEQ